MAYQVLARKWRPKQFEEVVGQVHVTRTLQNAIRHNKLAHAYLFTGTRGVGKTSIARLFAKAIRCEALKEDINPCLVCQSCRDIDSSTSLDYVEIDGASNNSVDDIRALIESVQYLPSRGKHKIYVIDEVHMLSTSAFNALLKTLEEPPSHTIFILATTDPQKLLGTVISRCQRYDFKSVSVPILEDHIKVISDAEGIKFANEKLIHKLAQLGKGSVRDTLSIFDQVLGLAAGEVITDEVFSQSLGLAATSAMKVLIESLLDGKIRELKNTFNQLVEANIDIKNLTDQVLEILFDAIDSLDGNTQTIISSDSLERLSLSEIFWIYETLTKDFTWGLSSPNPEKVVLIILQKIALRRDLLSNEGNLISSLKVSGGHEGKSNAGKSIEKKTPKTWEGFLNYVKVISPATASNLEQGNLIGSPNFSSENKLKVEIGFPEESALFKEFLEDKEVHDQLISYLADYSELTKEDVSFTAVLVKKNEKGLEDFKTRAQIEEEKLIKEAQEKRESVLNHPSIKGAQQLFQAQVDKVNLK